MHPGRPRSHRALEGGDYALLGVASQPLLAVRAWVRHPRDGHDAGSLEGLGAHVGAVAGERRLSVGRPLCSKAGSGKKKSSGVQSTHETIACQVRMGSTLPESRMDALPRCSAWRIADLGMPGRSNASAMAKGRTQDAGTHLESCSPQGEDAAPPEQDVQNPQPAGRLLGQDLHALAFG